MKRLAIYFEPRDLWIGVFIGPKQSAPTSRLSAPSGTMLVWRYIYVLPLPTLVIRIQTPMREELP